METTNTTILSSDSGTATQELRQEIYDKARVLVAVLGEDQEAEVFVKRADGLARSLGDPHWVVWIRRPEAVASVLAALKPPISLNQNPRGFATSLADQVKAVIGRDEPVPDLLRIRDLFNQAAG